MMYFSAICTDGGGGFHADLLNGAVSWHEHLGMYRKVIPCTTLKCVFLVILHSSKLLIQNVSIFIVCMYIDTSKFNFTTGRFGYFNIIYFKQTESEKEVSVFCPSRERGARHLSPVFPPIFHYEEPFYYINIHDLLFSL